MKILIVGAGAVGGYYGGHLAAAGHEVTYVARGDNARAIREHGIIVETPGGEIHSRVAVVDDIAQASGLGVDVAIIAVKAQALSEVAAGTGKALAPGGVAIPLLNGLDSEEVLADAIGRERVVGAVAQVAADLAAPGRARARSIGTIALSPLVPAQKVLVDEIAASFAKSGFPCRVVSDLSRMLWTKLLWNAPFNGVCAITGLSAGAVLAVPSLRTLVIDAMRELARVAKAEGVEISEEFISRSIAGTEKDFAESEPSMLQDVRAGRVTECDALQGAVVIRGEKHGIDTPIHRTLLSLLHGLEAEKGQDRPTISGA